MPEASPLVEILIAVSIFAVLAFISYNFQLAPSALIAGLITVAVALILSRLFGFEVAIRIIAVPPGEAPFWVRQQWVGLELPLAISTTARDYFGFGVVSGPQTRLRQVWAMLLGRAERIQGYAVEGARAVEILQSSSPEAAMWWRTHAAQILAPRRCFVFHAHVCQVISV